jgi:hypothetical protein
MDLSALPDVLSQLGILAKEIGKGGGGSTEEPTVCFSLVPVAAGVLYVVFMDLRRKLRRRAAPALDKT